MRSYETTCYVVNINLLALLSLPSTSMGCDIAVVHRVMHLIHSIFFILNLTSLALAPAPPPTLRVRCIRAGFHPAPNPEDLHPPPRKPECYTLGTAGNRHRPLCARAWENTVLCLLSIMWLVDAPGAFFTHPYCHLPICTIFSRYTQNCGAVSHVAAKSLWGRGGGFRRSVLCMVGWDGPRE